MTQGNEVHLRCGCHCHELHLEKDDELEVWYGSFWLRGYRETPDWKYRLRCIWHILRTGRPYGDEIVLERKDLEELREYLNKQIGS